ncbi:MAG: Lrp/AsnC family transcriptional regulator, partial [Chloroflexi bacterium]|nr:Lrp/AsnC family transcriptional regulator [Chloroflexota bacterium]
AMLAKDGRMSSAELARHVEAGERTVANRVNNLIESGVVSIIGVINEEYFGYEVTADIFCQVETAELEEIAHKIAALPETRYVGVSFGEHDISVQVVSKSSATLYQFVSKKLSKIPGINKVTTIIIPTIIKDIEEWMPPELSMVMNKNGEQK